MNLDELRAMKEKTDAIIQTLENDRKVLVSTKTKVIEDNEKDLMSFLLTLCDYVKLITRYRSNTFEKTNWLFEDFKDNNGYHVFYSEDMDICCGRENDNAKSFYLHLLCAGSEDSYSIYIYTDKAFFVPNKYHSNRCEQRFKKFLLDRKEDVRTVVENYIETYLTKLAEDSKADNDRLYSDIEKLNRE